MRTGLGDDSGGLVEAYITSMVDVVQPVMERSVVLAAEYSRACGRDVVLPEDMEYAMKYCAMHLVGRAIGSIAPEVYDSGDDDDDDDDEDVAEEDCPPFERYTGEDPKYTRMNEAYDEWNEWVPQNPMEHLLKNAINSNEHL